ncbi:PucR family transcriptional regulator [Streptomyces sp. NPDC048182]|uniref:PucR family transcriptional regulator n=1 Tax=Streptomyces sp. NPDC048182 TaxID=3365507 RepID=UPI003715B7EE
MHVEHLLSDESLGLRPLWAPDPLLRREISGVTVTDLEDPARFVRAGEVVLSGLVWWTPGEGRRRTERFVAALRDADAAVLLAGEETHGSVPGEVVAACAQHGIPVAAVPADVMFRAVTDTVYLRQWGEVSRGHALPENVRGRLGALLAEGAGPAEVLGACFAHLRPDVVAYLLTPAGRTVAATEGAPALAPAEAAARPAESGGATVPVEADAVDPYGSWRLYLPEPDAVPPRLLHEAAAVLARCHAAEARAVAADRRAADRLGALLAGAGEAASGEPASVEGALRDCRLPVQGPYRVLVATADPVGGAGGPAPGAGATAALAEVLAGAGAAAVGALPDGTAFAVVPGDAPPAGPGAVWPLVAACAPARALHGGTGTPAESRADLPGALTEARYALDSARHTAPGASLLTDAAGLTSVGALLTGVPAQVRAAYSRGVLGPLLDPANAFALPLLETLAVFLNCDGSWARAAEALHVHVNTVHYRVRRIEHFTGRDLSRLADRLDLWAALLCHA